MGHEKVKGPVIVAMKGSPCTGKSTVARAIAEALGCTVIDYDDIRACTATIHQILSPSTTEEEARTHLDVLSYEAVWRIASTQLRLLHSVVIDSTLSHEGQLNRLNQLAASSGASLFIVECKPQDESEWRRRVEEQQKGANDAVTSWYKPSTWDDLQTLLSLRGCYAQSDYESGNVPKLVVDTTSQAEIGEHVAAVMELIVSNIGNDGSELGGERSEEAAEGERLLLDEHDHPLTLSDEPKEEDCSLCDNSILGPNYSCTKCSYILHKSCAELPLLTKFPVYDEPLALCIDDGCRHFIKCNVCEDVNICEPFYQYTGILHSITIHRKCALIPANLKHGLHDSHPLQIKICSPSQNFQFECYICGSNGENACYQCQGCDFYLHVWCAFLPFTAKHSSHRHALTLALAPTEDSDEYYCDACELQRNPNQCTYYCAKCDFAAHLNCLVSITTI